MRKLVAVALLVASIPSAAFAENSITIGNFSVEITKDPFGDGTTAVAITGDDSHAIALRCLANGLSVAIVPDVGDLTPGDTYAVKLRADQKEVVDIQGMALNTHAIELVDVDQVFTDLSGARSVAVRVSGATTTTTFVLQLHQADRAVAIVRKSCGK